MLTDELRFSLDVLMISLLRALKFLQVAPFGGTKQSGLGREGSNYGIDEYLEVCWIASTSSLEIMSDFRNDSERSLHMHL